MSKGQRLDRSLSARLAKLVSKAGSSLSLLEQTDIPSNNSLAQHPLQSDAAAVAIPLEVDVETFCGSVTGTPGLHDGKGAEARFRAPEGIVAVGDTLYVADTGNK